MDNHSILYLFASDFFHQFLFYFGGVLAMCVFIWDKKFAKKPVEWKWILVFVLSAIFASCFQAWIDEHHNSTELIQEKAQLVSDKKGLTLQVATKQAEVDYLRDHREIIVQAGSGPDPNIAAVLDRLNRENQAMKKEPKEALKKAMVQLAKEMWDVFERQRQNMDAAEQEVQDAFRVTDPAERKIQQAKAKQDSDKASLQSESTLRSAMYQQFSPRAIALLEQVHTRGAASTGISDAEIDRASFICNTGGYWSIQTCAQDLSEFAQRMK